jgi:biotin carboxyl carrier protein
MSDYESFQRLVVDGTTYQTRLTRKHRARKPFVRKNENRIEAFIPGLIQKVFVTAGKKVKRGDPLLILEAMKMQNTVPSPHDGTIKTVLVKTGDKVAKDQLLLEFS